MKLIILKILLKLKWLKNRTISWPLTLNNHSYNVPIINETGFANHNMDEYWMLDLFNCLNKDQSNILLDIGANVGQTLIKWKAVFSNGNYIGIEPNPKCFNYLHRLSDLNNFNNTQIIEAAISSSSRKASLQFHYRDPADRTASLVKIGLPVIDTLEVSTLSWQELSTKINHNVTLIKIDTEGSETAIIKSMYNFILEKQPIIIFEFINQFDMDDKLNELNELLSSFEHQLYRIKKSQNRLDKLIPLEVIPKKVHVKDSDYILLHKDHLTRHSSFSDLI